MLKALAFLLLLPIGAPRQPPADSWVTVTAVMLFVGSRAERAYSAHWSGVESGPIAMPSMLSNWACKRGGRERGDQVTNYVECRAGAATVVMDVTCKTHEADADIGSAILLNKARNYGGRFIVTCVTADPSRPQ